MNSDFSFFYETLNRNLFKYFLTADAASVYASDIDMLPRELQSKAQEISPQAGGRVVRIQNIDPVIRELLTVRRIPVEEYEGRALRRSGHPLDYRDFSDICLQDTMPPTICALSVLSATREASFAYLSDGTIRTTRFLDDDLLSGVFSLVSSYNCVEMLFKNKEFERVADSWGVAGTVVQEDDPADMLCQYLKREFERVSFDREDVCLVDIRDYDLVSFGCVTRQGTRLLDQWTRSPCVSTETINRRLDLAEAFASIDISLAAIGDLKRMISKILSRRITVQETVKLYQTLQEIPALIASFRCHGLDGQLSDRNASEIAESFVRPLENVYKACAPLLEKIELEVDMETSRIAPGLTEELTALLARKKAVYDMIEEEYLQVKEQLPRVKYQSKLFRIPRSDYNRELFERNNLVVVGVLKTGATFTTRRLSDATSQLTAVETEVSAEEAKILNGIRHEAAAHVNSLEVYNYITALIDISKAFSRKTKHPGYSRPQFSDSIYSLEAFFHPVLENKECVVNSLSLSTDTQAHGKPKRLCILTGPNMGGKSTLLKALSMVSLYAQIGCYVPAKRAVLPVFDKIFLRVGAKDYSSRGLSTFMVEMLDLKKILLGATPKSLVLIDELGRGTSAIDGLSLVLAVKEFLIEKGMHALVATHFSGVGGEDTLNMKMSVMDGLMTYKIAPGTADSSFGIEVARMAGFDEEVIRAAEQYLEVAQ